MGFSKKMLAFFAAPLALGGAILLAGARATSNLKAKYQPVGKLYDMGGFQLHLYCQGEGGPTVVMDAGMGATGLSWTLVQQEVAKFTRVCVYDRAGLGWSQASPRPRTALVMAEELHQLLAKAGIPGPYILVGHSLGGLNARVFAHCYPDEVAGLVLVDAAHEDQYLDERMEKSMRSIVSQMTSTPMKLMARTGVATLMQSRIPPDPRLPVEAGYINKGIMTNGSHILGMIGELDDLLVSHAQVRAEQIGSLGDIPVQVIRHGKSTPQAIPEVTELVEETNVRLQSALAAQSPLASLVVADQATHDIPLDQPEIIIQAVREVWEAAQLRQQAQDAAGKGASSYKVME